MRVEFLLEEPSMEIALREVLPKILPKGYRLGSNCFLRPHAGKVDLQNSIARKIKVFSHFHETVKVVIVHDQHSDDCKRLKKSLLKICSQNGSCEVLIRVVCKELESWFLGDLNAIHKAYPSLHITSDMRKKFCDPDKFTNAADELKKLLKAVSKGKASREIAPYMDITANRSESFSQFVTGIGKFLSP